MKARIAKTATNLSSFCFTIPVYHKIFLFSLTKLCTIIWGMAVSVVHRHQKSLADEL